MKEARFFYVPDAKSQTELPLEEALHAVRVLRLKSGDEMFLMDGKGTFYEAEVTIAATKRCMYEIRRELPQEQAWNGQIHLAMAPTKMMDRVEWMAEKATEIGFDHLSFLNCKLSERKVMRTVRLDKIIVSATKQSRKPWKPVISSMVSLKEFVTQPREGKKFICHCIEEIERKGLFDELCQPFGDCADVTVMIGPEGDFTPDEVRLAMDNGFVSVSLGSSRLRTETAALSAVMLANLARRKQ